MYQNCCKKCGSIDLFTEQKGNNTGLYCSDCGAWIKWLGKDELEAFNHAKKEEVKIVTLQYKPNTYDKSIVRSCIVCGEATDNINDLICPACRAAIKWVREQCQETQ